jgi:hypothetical protein
MAREHAHGGVVAVEEARLVEQQMGVRGMLEEHAELLIRGDALGDVLDDAAEVDRALGRHIDSESSSGKSRPFLRRPTSSVVLPIRSSAELACPAA